MQCEFSDAEASKTVHAARRRIQAAQDQIEYLRAGINNDDKVVDNVMRQQRKVYEEKKMVQLFDKKPDGIPPFCHAVFKITRVVNGYNVDLRVAMCLTDDTEHEYPHHKWIMALVDTSAVTVDGPPMYVSIDMRGKDRVVY